MPPGAVDRGESRRRKCVKKMEKRARTEYIHTGLVELVDTRLVNVEDTSPVGSADSLPIDLVGTSNVCTGDDPRVDVGTVVDKTLGVRPDLDEDTTTCIEGAERRMTIRNDDDDSTYVCMYVLLTDGHLTETRTHDRQDSRNILETNHDQDAATYTPETERDQCES